MSNNRGKLVVEWFLGVGKEDINLIKVIIFNEKELKIIYEYIVMNKKNIEKLIK